LSLKQNLNNINGATACYLQRRYQCKNPTSYYFNCYNQDCDTTRIVINSLSAATNVKQNRIIAARMSAGNQQINEKSIMDSLLSVRNRQYANCKTQFLLTTSRQLTTT